MNKTELINAFYEANRGNGVETKTAASKCIESLIDIFNSEIGKGHEISITNFGRFHVEKRKARTGVNPQNGEKIEIKATKIVKFSPGKTLKESALKAKI